MSYEASWLSFNKLNLFSVHSTCLPARDMATPPWKARSTVRPSAPPPSTSSPRPLPDHPPSSCSPFTARSVPQTPPPALLPPPPPPPPPSPQTFTARSVPQTPTPSLLPPPPPPLSPQPFNSAQHAIAPPALDLATAIENVAEPVPPPLALPRRSSAKLQQNRRGSAKLQQARRRSAKVRRVLPVLE